MTRIGYKLLMISTMRTELKFYCETCKLTHCQCPLWSLLPRNGGVVVELEVLEYGAPIAQELGV